MKNTLILLFSFLLILPQFSFGQEPTRNCGAMGFLELQMQADPAIKARIQELERFSKQYVAQNAHTNRAVITIPTVIHIVYRSSSQNLSAAQVQSQMDVLNEDFSRMNSDRDNVWSQASATDIQFCLASVDPNGNATTGITRTSTKKRSFSYSNDGVKFASSGGHDAWPTDQYLNIWVCNLGNSLLGYAQFPNSGPANTDGVVNDYAYFGRGGTAQAPYDLGRTLTHEVGHWLNLRHIWGDGPCGVDDGLSDTPESDASNGGCAIGHVSCGSTDMVQNYMDYSYDACMNLFTSDQAARMQAALAGPRSSLQSSNGCGGGSGPTCSVPGGRSASNIGNNTATLSWSSVSSANSYNVQYRETGTSSWTTSSTSSTSTSVSGLNTCTDYEFQVESVCTGASSGYSGSTNFTTTGCTGGTCNTPSGVNGSVKGKNLKVNWNAVSGAVSYDCQARAQGTSTWSTTNVTGTQATFSGASRNTTYEFQVRANCNGSSSAYSSIATSRLASARFDEVKGLVVFPNPADQSLSIQFTEQEAGFTQVTLTNIMGKMVYHNQNVLTSSLEINTQELLPGVYFIRVENGKDFVEIQKVLIRH